MDGGRLGGRRGLADLPPRRPPQRTIGRETHPTAQGAVGLSAPLCPPARLGSAQADACRGNPRTAQGPLRPRLPRRRGQRAGLLRLLGRQQGLRPRRGHGEDSLVEIHRRADSPRPGLRQRQALRGFRRWHPLLLPRPQRRVALEIQPEPHRAEGPRSRQDGLARPDQVGHRRRWRRRLFRRRHLPGRGHRPLRAPGGRRHARVEERRPGRGRPRHVLPAGLHARLAHDPLRAQRPRLPGCLRPEDRQPPLPALLRQTRRRHLRRARGR